MDVATIGTSLTALNTLISITKSLIGLSKDAAINIKAAEMLSAIQPGWWRFAVSPAQ